MDKEVIQPTKQPTNVSVCMTKTRVITTTNSESSKNPPIIHLGRLGWYTIILFSQGIVSKAIGAAADILCFSFCDVTAMQ